MKLYAQIKMQILFIQEGEFTNKDTKETIKYYQAICVCDGTCDKISIKSEEVAAVQLGADNYCQIEFDSAGSGKPKIVAVQPNPFLPTGKEAAQKTPDKQPTATK